MIHDGTSSTRVGRCENCGGEISLPLLVAARIVIGTRLVHKDFITCLDNIKRKKDATKSYNLS